MNISLMKTHAPYVAEVLKILGHPKRLMLMCLLRNECAVAELSKACELSQSQTSQYLNDLERRKLLTSRAQGKQRYYQISDPKILELFQSLYSIYCNNP